MVTAYEYIVASVQMCFTFIPMLFKCTVRNSTAFTLYVLFGNHRSNRFPWLGLEKGMFGQSSSIWTWIPNSFHVIVGTIRASIVLHTTRILLKYVVEDLHQPTAVAVLAWAIMRALQVWVLGNHWNDISYSTINMVAMFMFRIYPEYWDSQLNALLIAMSLTIPCMLAKFDLDDLNKKYDNDNWRIRYISYARHKRLMAGYAKSVLAQATSTSTAPPSRAACEDPVMDMKIAFEDTLQTWFESVNPYSPSFPLPNQDKALCPTEKTSNNGISPAMPQAE